MKKFAIYNVVNLILLVGYVVLIVLKNQIKIINITNSDFWFSTLVIVVGISLLLKAIIFKSDSSTWFGSLLTTNGSVVFLSRQFALSYAMLWPTILSSIMLSSLLVAVFYKDWFHLKIFVWFLIVSVVCYLYSFKIITFLMFIVLLVISLVLAFVVAKLIPIKAFLTKRSNNG